MFRPAKIAWIRLLTPLGCWLAAAVSLGDAWVDPHDEPAPTWQVEADGVAEQLKRERVRLPGSAAGADDGAERIAYLAPLGYAARAWREVPPAAVIDELRIRLAGRSTAPGVSIVAEVVAPRTRDARGEAVRLRLGARPGPGLRGRAFEAELDRLPQRLAAEARVWRLANPDRAQTLDLREAYVARVGVLLPGAGVPTEAWISELEVEGLVSAARVGSATVSTDSEERSGVVAGTSLGGSFRRTSVTLRSEGFRIDGELFYPRVWRSRGEPFPTLTARGVNTVWLDHPPTARELAEAAQHRLRLICPPPIKAGPEGDWQRVLAWVLPGDQGEDDLDTGLVTLEAVQRLKGPAKRPVLASLTGGASAWSRLVDGLILDGPSAEVPPGVPVLVATTLDLDPMVAAQIDALLGGFVLPAWLPPDRVATGVERALKAGPVGLVFTASERLDSADDAAVAAAEWLEAINRRLRLIEPWLAGPRSMAPAARDASTVLLQRGGARLALRGPLVPTQLRAADLPSDGTVQPMRLTPAGVSLEAPRAGMVGETQPGDLLLASDPRVLKSLRRYTQRTAVPAAENLARVAASAVAASVALEEAPRSAAQTRLSASRLALSRRDPAAAYDEAYAALAIVAEAEAARVRLARGDKLLESSPLALLPVTLTEHFRMTQLLASSRRGPNRLHGGSFEDIDAARSAGWRRPTSQDEGAGVELIATDAVHGGRVLRLTSGSGSSAKIVAPPIELARGEVVEVTGWLRTPAAAGGAVTLVESLGGPSLAMRFDRPTDEWTPFRLLRAAPSDTTLELTIQVDDAITAEIDGVMMRAVEPLGVARRPGARTAGRVAPQAK